MPTYLYSCIASGALREVVECIDAMAFHEEQGVVCKCGSLMQREYRPKRHITFKEGVYENVGDSPIYMHSAQQLADECKKRGNTSHYISDLGGILGAKENRWI